MPTIIRCGGGIPVSDYESLQTDYNSYKSSHSHTNDEYTSYGTAQYNAGQSSLGNEINNMSAIYKSTKNGNYASGGSYTFTHDYRMVIVVTFCGGEGGDSAYGSIKFNDANRIVSFPTMQKWNGNSNSGCNIALLKNVKSGESVSFGSFGATGGGGVYVIALE